MAPEIILVAGHSVGADHWALGICIYEMLTGEHPCKLLHKNQRLLSSVVQNAVRF